MLVPSVMTRYVGLKESLQLKIIAGGSFYDASERARACTLIYTRAGGWNEIIYIREYARKRVLESFFSNARRALFAKDFAKARDDLILGKKMCVRAWAEDFFRAWFCELDETVFERLSKLGFRANLFFASF